MIATILKIENKKSKYGGNMSVVFFKGNDGKSYYTYCYSKMRNYARWKKVLKEGLVLKRLRLLHKNKNLIDADSKFKIVEE